MDGLPPVLALSDEETGEPCPAGGVPDEARQPLVQVGSAASRQKRKASSVDSNALRAKLWRMTQSVCKCSRMVAVHRHRASCFRQFASADLLQKLLTLHLELQALHKLDSDQRDS